MLQTAAQFEFRCSKCWQSLIAVSDQTGESIECRWCRAQVVVPEPDAEAIQRAEAYQEDEEDSRLGSFAPEARLSKRQMAVEAKRRATSNRSQRQASRSRGRLAADRLSRLFAQLIDTALVCIIIAFAWFVSHKTHKAYGSPFELALLFVFLFSLIQVSLLALRGQSIGKLMIGIKVVTSAGFPPGFLRILFLRNIFVWIVVAVWLTPAEWWLAHAMIRQAVPIVLVLDIAFIVMEPPRCLHDHLAGTHVVFS